MTASFVWRHVLIPVHEHLKARRTMAYFHDLGRSQWRSEPELRDLQLAALRRLLVHARDSCPYFAETWHARGLSPESVHSLEDFQQFPLTTRADVSEHREEMRSRAPQLRVTAKATGGSTGEPVRFYLNADSFDRRMAASWRGYDWAGAGPGAKLLLIWGQWEPHPTLKRRLQQWGFDVIHRRHVINAFDVRHGDTWHYAALLEHYRPDAIVGFSGALVAFARLLDDAGYQPYAPRAIVAGAETLYDFHKEFLQRVFRCPVFETYGSREFMLMAAECEARSGLHLTAEQLLLEIVDEEGEPVPAGVEGRVAVTDLYNYGMPFIRYLNGDCAVAASGSCTCQRGLPRLERIVGRTADVLELRNGKCVSGLLFPHLFKDRPEVREFQIVQEGPSAITCRIVPTRAWTASHESEIRALVQPILGEDVRIGVEVVPDISLTPVGKHRILVKA